MKNTSNKVYANVSVVTGLSVAERALGFLYRILLSRLLGAEGLGVYQVALALFGLFATIGSGGIPISVSRALSKAKAERNTLGEGRAVGAGLLLSSLFTLPVCLLLGTFGDKFPFLFSDERAFRVFRILLIGLPFTSLYAVFRGGFWGNKEFLVPSVLEIAEESVMVLCGVFLLRHAPNSAFGAGRAAWAVVISYLFSFTASAICYFAKGGKIRTPKNALKPLFNATLPVTSVRACGSLINSAVAVLLPAMLVKTGMSERDAIKLFGVVTGMAMPVLSIPSTLVGSFALVLVPELSKDDYEGKHERVRRNVLRGLRFSLFISCALIVLLFSVGEGLGTLAFSNAEAGKIISVGAFLLLPMSVTMITTSALNALGYEKQTFRFYFVGATALLLCVLFLPRVCGVYAYLWGLSAAYLLNALCNLVFLKKRGLLPEGKRAKEEVRFLLPLLPITLLLACFGKSLSGVCALFFGEPIKDAIVVVLLLFFGCVFYAVCGFFPTKGGKRARLRQKRRKKGEKRSFFFTFPLDNGQVKE